MFIASDVIGEIYKLPAYTLIGNNSGETVADDNMLQGIRTAVRIFYEQKFGQISFYQNTTADPGIVLPAGTAWGSTGKIYNLTMITGPLPPDFRLPTSLWIIGDAGLVTPSSSSYDTGAAQIVGIPNSASPALSNSNVFHEIVSGGNGVTLRIYVGSVAAGAAPHCGMIYNRSVTLPITTADAVDVPDELRQSIFMPIVSTQLQTLGFPAF